MPGFNCFTLINSCMKIKSRLTGLEQTVSEETFQKMEEMKPGLHKKIADDVQTPPEAIEQEGDKQRIANRNTSLTVLPAGAPAPPDSTPEV